MPGFYYFLPGISRLAPMPSAEEIAARGLSYAFEGRPHGRGCTIAGIEGYILGCRRRFADVGYVYWDAAQQWHPHPSGKYSVGYYPDQLPGPAELGRAKLLDGHSIELADNRPWQVPLARSVHDPESAWQICAWACDLPQAVSLDAHGNWVEQGPLPRYQALWDLLQSWNDVRRSFADDPGAASLLEHWSTYKVRVDAAVQVLATNYVVGPVECSILKLLTKELAKEVLDLAIDQPEFERLLKKYLATVAQAQPTAAVAGSTSLAGPADSNQVTPPPLPT